MMKKLDDVPIIDVQKDNFKQLWPGMLLAIRSSTFIAIDTELSGLGDRKCLSARDVDDRFKALSKVSKSHSILSLGLSCFKLIPKIESTDILVSEDIKMKNGNFSEDHVEFPEAWTILIKELSKRDKANLTFQVQTYNITLLCSESYVVEPESLTFLVDHGFDFNKQYSVGVPYYRGPNKVNEKIDQSMRCLFGELVISKVPVVFHNAFVDLVFLYHNLYTAIPPTLNMFLSDLSEIFQGGVYDTKYISEFYIRWPASYLEYIFRRSLHENELKTSENSRSVQIQFLKYVKSATYVDYKDCSKNSNEYDAERKDVCQMFAAHGWCKNGRRCLQSHNMDHILNDEWAHQSRKKKRRKRRKHGQEFDKQLNLDTPQKEQSQSTLDILSANKKENKDKINYNVHSDGSMEKKVDENSDNCAAIILDMDEARSDSLLDQKQTTLQQADGHRAGFDAFMTGFSMAVFLLKHDHQLQKLFDMSNKICLTGKQHPLKIFKSEFSKTSKDHMEKMSQLMESTL